MTIGPGNYDGECSMIRATTNAAGVVVIVVGGARGNGVSVQADGEALVVLPLVLLKVAEELTDDIARSAVTIAGDKASNAMRDLALVILRALNDDADDRRKH